MTVDELFARFPEIPADLHGEPLLAEFAETFDRLLQLAQKPSACAEQHDRGNQYYLKLVGPMDIYRYGLFTRERVLEEIQTYLVAYQADPEAFASGLVSENA
jgi:hypothetical protein